MADDLVNRPKSEAEIIGDRCLLVCKKYADADGASVRMIGEFYWALGLIPSFTFTPIEHGAAVQNEITKETAG